MMRGKIGMLLNRPVRSVRLWTDRFFKNFGLVRLGLIRV